MFRDRNDFKDFLKHSDKEVTILKFTAKWCGPCKSIAPCVRQMLETYKQCNFRYYEIDIDEYSDTYAFFKKKRMLNGIPAFCVYYKSRYDEDTFYVPSHIVTGANKDAIEKMFADCLKPI